jgi:hypothetical protein
MTSDKMTDPRYPGAQVAPYAGAPASYPGEPATSYPGDLGRPLDASAPYTGAAYPGIAAPAPRSLETRLATLEAAAAPAGFTPYYNAPGDPRDLVAHFHSAAEANAYIAKYGGTLAQSGVVFTVSGNADHTAAREAIRADAARSAAQAAISAGVGFAGLTRADFDAALAKAVSDALASRDAVAVGVPLPITPPAALTPAQASERAAFEADAAATREAAIAAAASRSSAPVTAPVFTAPAVQAPAE